MKITKEQMQHLSPEQQEALASIELQRAQKRQRLLDQVGGRPAMRWLPMLVVSLVICIVFVSMFITNGKHAPSTILCLALIPCFLIEFQVASIHRRLDALIELLESDKKESGTDA